MTEVTETPIDVQALRQAMDQSHAVYSDMHAETVTAERKLQEAATRLGALNKRRKSLAYAAEKLKAELVQLLTADPTAKLDLSKIVATREEASIVDDAIRVLQTGTYRDLERTHLVAQLAEVRSQHQSEECRLMHHEAALNQQLASVASLAGGEITVADHGNIAEQLREIVAQLVDRVQRAREALSEFDIVQRAKE